MEREGTVRKGFGRGKKCKGGNEMGGKGRHCKGISRLPSESTGDPTKLVCHGD